MKQEASMVCLDAGSADGKAAATQPHSIRMYTQGKDNVKGTRSPGKKHVSCVCGYLGVGINAWQAECGGGRGRGRK